MDDPPRVAFGERVGDLRRDLDGAAGVHGPPPISSRSDGPAANS